MNAGIAPGVRMPPIIRAPLRQEIRRIVLEGILRGTLGPGTDVNEAILAASLGVSRTPLREALLSLELRVDLGELAALLGGDRARRPERERFEGPQEGIDLLDIPLG